MRQCEGSPRLPLNWLPLVEHRGLVGGDVHVAAHVVNHLHFMAPLFAGLLQPPSRVERRIPGQNYNFHGGVRS